VKISEADILIAPGLGNSGPEHWQRRWADRMTTARVIEQHDWTTPVLADWVDRIHQEIMLSTRPVVLIGHSLSVPAIVHTAQLRLKDTKVRGAFLVSPPDFESGAIPETAQPFANVPTDPLPFPSMVVASTTDPLVSVERAQGFAADWGSDFLLAGDAGHINAASGHGPWPEGLLMFAELMKRLKA
jgi:predicted alpha/beta hydrolase family esterase